MKKYLKLIRVHHYIKNLLVLLPLIYSGQMLLFGALIKSLFGFLAFSAACSIVYIINDVLDIDFDRKHPVKCKRPLASGDVTVASAKVIIVILLLLVVVLNYLACETNMITWIYVSLYIILNVLYSMRLKNIPLVDVTILVIGFLIRVLYGSSIINVDVSNWMYLTIMSMSFYLGLGKRRNEIKKLGDTSRNVLKYYTYQFLDKNMYTCITLAIVFYSLWCVDPNTIAKHSCRGIVWTVPLVMLICMKYSLNIEGNSQGDPVEVLLGDKMLIVLVGLYGIVIFSIIYLNPVVQFVELAIG